MAQAIKPTEEQKLIIEHQSHLVAIARPGSGKTYVLTEKIRNILTTAKTHQGVIAISYTNKASDEIKRRVRQANVEFLGSFFGTIDRFCDTEIILPFLPQVWGLPTEDVLVTRIRDLPQDEQEQFSKIEPNRVSIEVLQEHLQLVRSYYLKGKLFLEMNGALALFVVRSSAACRRYLKSRYTHIFVDEYQDSGLEQHELFLELKSAGLVAVAVGDIDQSIFGFSGKDSKYLATLAGRQDFKTFPITFNHRCHRSIINYSLRLLDQDSELVPTDAIHVYYKEVVGNEAATAKWIGQKLNSICQYFDVAKMSDVGVLVRGTRTAEMVDAAFPLKHRFIRAHPLEEHFSIWGKLFARLLAYHFDENTTAQEIIDEFAAGNLGGHEMRNARKLVKALGKADLPTTDEFVGVATALAPNARVDSAIALLDDSLKEDGLATWFVEPADDEVQIMTLHKAKGLEFDVVFHLDLLEWVLPAKRPGPGDDFDHPVYPNLEQDLHLHYVGVTRARKCCVLCSSTRRTNADGQSRQGNPSEFLGLKSLGDLRRPVDAILAAK